jgi:hypothetical protein
VRYRQLWTGLVVAAIYACGTMREDEQLCEEAVAQLVTCCPGFDVTQVSCQYSDSCLSDSDQFPALSIKDSECIREKSCASLQAGICARAQAARRGSTSAQQVCQ